MLRRIDSRGWEEGGGDAERDPVHHHPAAHVLACLCSSRAAPGNRTAAVTSSGTSDSASLPVTGSIDTPTVRQGLPIRTATQSHPSFCFSEWASDLPCPRLSGGNAIWVCLTGPVTEYRRTSVAYEYIRAPSHRFNLTRHLYLTNAATHLCNDT
ncbi:hypothetical protein TPAR_01194 [Tolypocladium paradoxum]|uniref:Uncharacterized protein n=1 Tax=Tolypocladium paradoxum TaxID=94208 RepID=A0A2S4L832_9HYPO|nr:hypothetical protein TPAR_01194 [Tolypocladium paradoxum]